MLESCNYVDFAGGVHLGCMEKHLVETNPDLSAEQEIAFVICMPCGDLGHDNRLRAHVGAHPGVLRSVADILAPKQIRPFHEHVVQWLTAGRERRP